MRDPVVTGMFDQGRRLASFLIRLLGLGIFGYSATWLLMNGIGELSPVSTPRGTLGPYPLTFAIACAGAGLSVWLAYRLLRSRSLAAALGWVLGGVLGMIAAFIAFVLSVPALT
jgi:hypothetical protein